jgi:MoxR-like ATPase
MSARDRILDLKRRITAAVIGQEAVVDLLLVALLADGHLLMEGLPGLAKTRTIKSLAKNLESEFRRIQFTPDLLPSDITGTEIYTGEGAGGTFRFQPGPIFGNLILADEINRAPAKAQAALLEAMEERQVTSGGKTTSPPAFSRAGDSKSHRARGDLSAAGGANGSLSLACFYRVPN